MNLDVFLVPESVPEEALKGKVVVVIDVLRASSTIVTALQNGARAIVPVADMAAAGKLAEHLDTETGLLGGERGGKRIEGYQVGNSPFEYTPEVVKNRTVILTTTNGTRALTLAKGAAAVVVGCFLNAGRVVEFVRERNQDTVLLCSGWEGRVSLEDTLCAGLLLHQLWEHREPSDISDDAHIAYAMYRADKNRLRRTIFHCDHGRRLVGLGAQADIDYCIQIDAVPALPIYRDSRLVLDRPRKTEG